MTRVAVYELTKFENGTGTVKVNVKQNARPQDVKVEGRPGVEQRVIKMTATSTGTHVFSLTKILPKMGILSSASEAHMEVEPQYRRLGQLKIPEPNRDFVAIAAGTHYSLGSKKDGTIIACRKDKLREFLLPEPNTDFVAVSAAVK